MAKLCVLELSPKGEASEALKEDMSPWEVREVELAVLSNLMMIAANSQKDNKKLNVCYDLVEEIKGITDEMDAFKISPSDLKEYLIPAIEKSVDKRPESWYFARKLFKSIENPKIVEV